MAAFANENQFAIEFSIRTLLNYYNLLLQITEDNLERDKIQEKVVRLVTIMENNGFANVNLCCGTQLINSVLGLLVFPEQQLYNDISSYTSPDKWKRDFPTLSKYVLSKNNEIFNNTYTYRDRRDDRDKDEKISPKNVIRHMRNSVSHKKISLYPVNANHNGGVNEVTHIVFFDYNEGANDGKRFELKICKKDFDAVMEEISYYFINFETIKAQDARKC